MFVGARYIEEDLFVINAEFCKKENMYESNVDIVSHKN